VIFYVFVVAFIDNAVSIGGGTCSVVDVRLLIVERSFTKTKRSAKRKTASAFDVIWNGQ
jgi:hypothetical protein